MPILLKRHRALSQIRNTLDAHLTPNGLVGKPTIEGQPDETKCSKEEVMDLHATYWACREHRRGNSELPDVGNFRRGMANGWRPFLTNYGMAKCRIRNGQCRRLSMAYYFVDNCVRISHSLGPSLS